MGYGGWSLELPGTLICSCRKLDAESAAGPSHHETISFECLAIIP